MREKYCLLQLRCQLSQWILRKLLKELNIVHFRAINAESINYTFLKYQNGVVVPAPCGWEGQFFIAWFSDPHFRMVQKSLLEGGNGAHSCWSCKLWENDIRQCDRGNTVLYFFSIISLDNSTKIWFQLLDLICVKSRKETSPLRLKYQSCCSLVALGYRWTTTLSKYVGEILPRS